MSTGDDRRRRAAAPPATPLLLKREGAFAWPEEPRMFYLLARSGLFRCRNHEFFKSCVPADRGPGELEEQEPFVECGFPVIPQADFERIVGFFDAIRGLHNAEASVLLAYDRERERVHVVVPEQTATVVRYASGHQHPVGLVYHPPIDLPPSWIVFGDVHSHVDLSAYSSATDVDDEAFSAGLHIVLGQLYREPMQAHVEVVVDGSRFGLRLEDVVAGYGRRSRKVPDGWIAKVKIEAAPSAGWWSAGAGHAPVSSESAYDAGEGRR